MLDLDARVRPNRKDVASKILDGEAIMIDLTKGTYYSLDGAGTLTWELVESECTLGQIADAIARGFEVSPETARADAEGLVEQMLSEGLVERVREEVTRETAPPAKTPEKRLAYHVPGLCIYRDMADLLALEPPTPGAAQENLWEGTA